MAFIKKQTVRKWLDNYSYIVYGGRPDGDGGNSGQKPIDGITNRQLTKIMLESAISKLPSDLKRVVYFRWVDNFPLAFVLNALQMTKDQYYYRCDKAVAFMCDILNQV